MAENNNIGFILPQATSMVRDYASTYVAIGNEFTKRYYQNREAYINNIINPLSKVQARKDDQVLLNDIKNGITEKANKFKESDRWHFAQDYIYDATQDILTNEGLKAIQNSYAAEQAYNDSLSKSDWDSRMQMAFKIRSLAQSSAIEYDKDTNTVLGGGFNGVNIGKKFDESKYFDKVFNMLSKANADGITTSQLVTNPDILKQYGADTILGVDGKEVASHFVKLKQSKKEIKEDDIYNYARQMLSSNTDYINYLNTVFENENALNLYVKDDTTNNGFRFRDYELSDLTSLFGNTISSAMLKGLGVNVGDYGVINSKNGEFEYSKLSVEQKHEIDNFKSLYGFDLKNLINGKVELDRELVEQGLNNYINDTYELQGASLGYNKQDWLKHKLNQKFIKDKIHEFASSTSGIIAYKDIKNEFDFESNEAYKIWAKERAEGTTTNSNELPGNTLFGITESKSRLLDPSNWIDKLTNAGESLAVLENSPIPQFTTDELQLLGINSGNPKDLTSLNYKDVEKALTDNIDDLEIRNDLYARAIEYINRYNNIKSLKSQINVHDRDIENVIKMYNENPNKYNGIGWYGITDETAKLILKNNIKTYKEYLNRPDIHYIYDLRGNKIPNRLTKESFNQVLGNALENIINRANKNGENVSFTTNSYLVENPPLIQQERLDGHVAVWKKDTGGLKGISGLDVNGKSLSQSQLSKLIGLDNRTTRWTYGKNNSTSIQNTPNKNSQFLDGDEYGIDGKIWYTTINYVDDPDSYRLGRQRYQITCYDESNMNIGKITLFEELGNNKQRPAMDILNRYGLLNQFNIDDDTNDVRKGIELSMYTNSFVDFTNSGKNNTVKFDDIVDLEKTLDNEGSVKTRIEIRNPLNGGIDGNSRDVLINKHDSNGNIYYTIKDLSKNYNIGYDNIGFSNIGNRVIGTQFGSPTDAINVFVQAILDINYKAKLANNKYH